MEFYSDYNQFCHAFSLKTYLYDCEFRLLVKYLFVCIATNTPEDGRVVDETSLHLAPDCGCFRCRGELKHRALGPIKQYKACLFSQFHTSPQIILRFYDL